MSAAADFDAGRLRRNVRWQLVANAAQAVLGGLYLLLLARSLGSADFGVYAIVAALVSVAGLLAEFRIQDVVASELHGLEDDVAPADGQRLLDLLGLEAAARLLPALALLALSGTLAAASGISPAAQETLGIAALGFVLSKTGSGVATGLLRVLGRSDAIAACQALDWGGRLAITAALAWSAGIGLASVFWIAAVVAGAANAIQCAIALRVFRSRGGSLAWRGWSWSAAATRWRARRRLLAANWGISLTDLLARDMDIVLISTVLAADKVGLYKMSKSLVQLLWRVVDPFYLALMPELQKLAAQHRYAALRALVRTTTLRMLGLGTALLGLGYAAALLFALPVLGPHYAQLPPLIAAMGGWIVGCAPLIWGHPLAVAARRPELAVLGNGTGMVCGLAAFGLLTPAFGLYGAAAAWGITLVTGFALTAVTAFRALGLQRASHDAVSLKEARP